MELPDGTTLMHGKTPYDPVKAHEYYLRVRKLKGRQPGEKQQTARGKGVSYTIKGSNGKSTRLSPQKLEEQKVYAAARVTHIKKTLQELQTVLRNKKQKAAEAAKPPTLAEKAAAARKEMAYRKAHPNETKAAEKKAAKKAASSGSSSSTSTSSSSTDTVDSLNKQIATTKTRLKAAVAKQRELATAKKNG